MEISLNKIHSMNTSQFRLSYEIIYLYINLITHNEEKFEGFV